MACGRRSTHTTSRALQKFDAKEFLTIAKTGVEPDGTKFWQKYWYVQQPGSKVAYALEGYLYPAGYYFFPNADAKTVIEKMLDQFGVELCPGPANNPTEYIYDPTQCRQHAATINGKNIFDLMRAAYPDTKSDVAAIHDMLIISSLTAREIKNYSDAAGVAAVYHNRYLHNLDQNKYPADVGRTFGSDPSVEYARDNDNPPTDGKWWTALINGSGGDISPNNPYNLYTQPGYAARPNRQSVLGRDGRGHRAGDVAELLLRLQQLLQDTLCQGFRRLRSDQGADDRREMLAFRAGGRTTGALRENAPERACSYLVAKAGG